MEPLVSCIMPTFNRARFTAQAIRYFARQDYARRELIVVDDGSDAAMPEERSGGPAIRYVRLDSRKTVGEKRNIACEAAQGEIILHWDDDDWQASWRISY